MIGLASQRILKKSAIQGFFFLSYFKTYYTRTEQVPDISLSAEYKIMSKVPAFLEVIQQERKENVTDNYFDLCYAREYSK